MGSSAVGVLVTFTLVILTAPPAPTRSSRAKLPLIGHLALRAGPGAEDEVFKQGLRDLGWIEGQSLAIEYRWADGQVNRLPPWQRSWSACRWTASSRGPRQRSGLPKDATQTIPIVMTWVADPIGSGFVASLAQPGATLPGHPSCIRRWSSSGWSCSEPCCRASPAWPSWPMEVIPSIGSSSRKRRTPRSVLACRRSRELLGVLRGWRVPLQLCTESGPRR